MKKIKPIVKLPKSVVTQASLGSRNGKIDRVYLRAMASAIDSANKHKYDSMRKVTRELSDAEG